MNENRASQIVEAEQTINTLSTELLKNKADVKAWKIEVDVEMVMNDGGVPDIHITAKTGQRGMSNVISHDSALYFSNDISTVVDNLTRTILIDELGPQLRGELSTKLTKAFHNAKQVTKSSL